MAHILYSWGQGKEIRVVEPKKKKRKKEIGYTNYGRAGSGFSCRMPDIKPDNPAYLVRYSG